MILKSRIESWKNKLFEPTNALTLSIFRMLFGILMFIYVYDFRTTDVVNSFFIEPRFHFTYPLFDWLHLPIFSEQILRLIFVLTGISALGIAIGFLYRFSLIIFIGCFGYIFLLEKSYYNNYYYLILLISFLLLFMNAHSYLSIDSLINKKKRAESVPYWNLFLLRMQICFVYFFSALDKLQWDWLNGVISHMDFPLHPKWMIVSLAWAGFFAELAIAFLLLFRKTYIVAAVVVIFFHVFIRIISGVGIFSYLMLATLILFIDPSHFKFLKLDFNNMQLERYRLKNSNIILWMICLYLIVQFVVPLRHFIYPGKVNWNQRGDRFSWKMTTHQNLGHIDFYVTDLYSAKTEEVFRLKDIIYPMYFKMSFYPDMIVQYAHHIKDIYKQKGWIEPVVTVNSLVALNVKNFTLFINPYINLAAINYPLINYKDLIYPHPDVSLYKTNTTMDNSEDLYSSEYRLAIADYGQLLPGDDPLVLRIKFLLEQLKQRVPNSYSDLSHLVERVVVELEYNHRISLSAVDVLEKLNDTLGSYKDEITMEMVLPFFLNNAK